MYSNSLKKVFLFIILFEVSTAKRDQIVKKFFFEIMNILDQMIKFTSISLMKKFFIKFSIWSLFAALTPFVIIKIILIK